jgi:hypothetical protein
MAYDIDDIAAAIAASLESLAADGIGVQATPYILSNPTATGVYVSEGEITYDLAMHRGLDRFEMRVTLLVGLGSDQAAQRRLRKLRDGNTGVKALVEVDKTLGGLVDHARISKVSAPRLYGPEGGKGVLGCEFTVDIYATP